MIMLKEGDSFIAKVNKHIYNCQQPENKGVTFETDETIFGDSLVGKVGWDMPLVCTGFRRVPRGKFKGRIMEFLAEDKYGNELRINRQMFTIQKEV